MTGDINTFTVYVMQFFFLISMSENLHAAPLRTGSEEKKDCLPADRKFVGDK